MLQMGPREKTNSVDIDIPLALIKSLEIYRLVVNFLASYVGLVSIKLCDSFNGHLLFKKYYCF